MTTLAPARMKALASKVDAKFKSAVFSGIVGDKAHQAAGGYHISIEDQPSNNYSVTRKDDKAPPGAWPRNMASALDMSMSTADMKTTYGRFLAAFNDKTDPRRKFINAVNGYDGSGDATRLDFVTNTKSYASPDHKWHTHMEMRRRYVNDDKAYDAVWSIWSGESKSAYIKRTTGSVPPAKPSGHLPGTRDLKQASPMMTGDDVKYVQKWIRGTASNAIAVDGVWGPATTARFKWWQGQRGRAQTGVCTKTDWKDMGVTVKY